MECALVELTGWSLVDIDATDIESMIPFMFTYPRWKNKQETPRQEELFADDVDWF